MTEQIFAWGALATLLMGGYTILKNYLDSIILKKEKKFKLVSEIISDAFLQYRILYSYMEIFIQRNYNILRYNNGEIKIGMLQKDLTDKKGDETTINLKIDNIKKSQSTIIGTVDYYAKRQEECESKLMDNDSRLKRYVIIFNSLFTKESLTEKRIPGQIEEIINFEFFEPNLTLWNKTDYEKYYDNDDGPNDLIKISREELKESILEKVNTLASNLEKILKSI
jgi:hypothetical protein